MESEETEADGGSQAQDGSCTEAVHGDRDGHILTSVQAAVTRSHRYGSQCGPSDASSTTAITPFSFRPPPRPQNTMEHEVDGWVAQLSQCKQLSEADVKKLCDKVRFAPDV